MWNDQDMEETEEEPEEDPGPPYPKPPGGDPPNSVWNRQTGVYDLLPKDHPDYDPTWGGYSEADRLEGEVQQRRDCEAKGGTWDGINKKCKGGKKCPRGQKWDGSKCVASCKPGYTWNDAEQRCKKDQKPPPPPPPPPPTPPPGADDLYPPRVPDDGVGTIADVLKAVGAGPSPDPMRPYGETYEARPYGETYEARPYGKEFERPGYEDFSKSPGFRFMLNEGLRAVERTASASGNLRTLGTLKQLQQRAEGIASTGYNQFYGQEMDAFGMNRGTHFMNEDDRAAAFGVNRGTHFMNEGDRSAAFGVNKDTHISNERNRYVSERQNQQDDRNLFLDQQKFKRGNYEYGSEYDWRRGRAKTSDILTLAQLGVPTQGSY